MTIISHTHGLIFLRTRKTASTSIEYALLPHLRRGDFISTSTGAEPLDHPWWNTANRTTRWKWEVPLKRRLARWRKLRRFDIYMHEPAHGVRRAVRGEVWYGYTKISVERHPYDRVISMYHWRTRGMKPKPSLREFIEFLEEQQASKRNWRGKGPKWQLYSNWPIYAIGDEIVADHVIQYENLATELPKVLAEHGIHDLQLGRNKSRFRDPDATVDTLDADLRRRIQRLYRREFEAFGYQT